MITGVLMVNIHSASAFINKKTGYRFGILFFYLTVEGLAFDYIVFCNG